MIPSQLTLHAEDPGDACRLTVCFDGSCPLCSAEIRHYASQPGSERLCFIDVSAPGAETGTGLPRQAALRRFHVRQADGELLSGARAFAAIWQVLPAWRPATRVANIPGMTSLLEAAYRLFLPMRALLSRFAAALGTQPHNRIALTVRAEPGEEAGVELDGRQPTPLARLLLLANGARNPPPGHACILLAIALGAAVHTVFAAAVLAMIAAMWFGMNASFGRVPQPWNWLANGLLLLQFPLAHSLLLTKRGERILARLVPGRYGATLSTTTYALIASAQLLALFALWTPSGTIWWKADGPTLWLIGAAYSASWMLLMKASYDAGAEVQSGALGWMSLMAARRPVFPDMPTDGMFRVIRQPIYVAFALTLWTIPVWTPDQLALAVSYTAYCVLAPRLKERRFAARYGDRFERYRAEVPYLVPRLARLRMSPGAQRSRDL